MPLILKHGEVDSWSVRSIAVFGAGSVGLPMAARLAHARIREGCETPAKVVLVQRLSFASGWKVDAINQGRSLKPHVEPDLDRLIRDAVAKGSLSASYDADSARTADVVLICVEDDERGSAPAPEALLEALAGLAEAFRHKPRENVPVVILQSTLTPPAMDTPVRDLFARYGLKDGRDLFLGYSASHIADRHPTTSELIDRFYRWMVHGTSQSRLMEYAGLD
jgi:UDP-N-acetyl-D-mannosaminuronate dehydrogenase